MKRKLMLGITVLFMIIAVIFTACPTDEGSSSGGSSSPSGGGSPDMDKPIVDGQNVDPDPDGGGTGYKDDDVTLKATVTDETQVLSYQWYINTAPNNTGGAIINGATSKEYTPEISFTGTRYFYVVVKYKNGKSVASNPYRVTILLSEGVNAALPYINPLEPADKRYFLDIAAEPPLTVEFSVADSYSLDGATKYPSTITYQWYRNTERSNSNGTKIGEETTLAEGVRKITYPPSTGTVGKTYYYVEITNTIQDDGLGGKKSRTAASRAAEVEVELGAKPPSISVQPKNAMYELNDKNLKSLSVGASSPDNGKLSYQWYIKYENSDENARGIEIEGATLESYLPKIDEKGLVYYYCEVTNTITVNGLSATNSKKSDVVYISVELIPLTITGLSMDNVNRIYDGNKDATDYVLGTGVLTAPGNISLGDAKVQLEKGSAEYQTPNAGTNIPVTLKSTSWRLIGDDKDSFALILPTDLKGTIHKAPGSSVSNPVADSSVNPNPTSYKITVASVSLTDTTTGQSVEYAIVEGSSAPTTEPADNKWQDSQIFTGLNVTTTNNVTVGKDYYICVRAKESPNYTKGEWKSVKISTVPGSKVSVPEKDGEPTDSSITVGEVSLLNTTTGQTVLYNISKKDNGTEYLYSEWQTALTFSNLEAAISYYVYARTRASENFSLGDYSVSESIETANPIVTFVTPGAVTNIGPKTFERGDLLVKNTLNPVRFNHTVEHWYLDSALTIPYDFSQPITRSFTLYVGWLYTPDVEGADTEEGRNMVWVPGGWFKMGNPTGNIPGVTPATPVPVDETPQHDIGLKGFWMGKYQVTQELWTEVMKDYKGGIYAYPNAGSGAPASGEVQGKRPVTNVNWYQALVFCNYLSAKDQLGRVYKINNSVYPTDWGEIPTSDSSPNKALWDAVVMVPNATGYRLATEAQWEYACRAGSKTNYYEGDTFSGNYGWFNDNSGGQSHEVGKKNKNAFGLYDMHGNVWEWCWDWYSNSYYATFTSPTNPASPINPVGPVSGTMRFFRGGSCVYPAVGVRSTIRYAFAPYGSSNNVGLRIVRP